MNFKKHTRKSCLHQRRVLVGLNMQHMFSYMRTSKDRAALLIIAAKCSSNAECA